MLQSEVPPWLSLTQVDIPSCQEYIRTVARVRVYNCNRSPQSRQNYWTVLVKHPVTCFSDNGFCYTAWQYVLNLLVPVVNSNPVWNFSELHTLTLATSSYALLILHMTWSSRPSISVLCTVSHLQLDGGKINPLCNVSPRTACWNWSSVGQAKQLWSWKLTICCLGQRMWV